MRRRLSAITVTRRRRVWQALSRVGVGFVGTDAPVRQRLHSIVSNEIAAAAACLLPPGSSGPVFQGNPVRSRRVGAATAKLAFCGLGPRWLLKKTPVSLAATCDGQVTREISSRDV